MRPRCVPFVATLLVVGLAACSDSGTKASQTSKSSAKPAPTAAPAPTASVAPTPKKELKEEDFVESDRSRDPFRSFAAAFVEQARTQVRSQRHVLIDKYSVDDLRLVGIVNRADPPRAMLVDPSGKGWVVTRGQLIGRAEIVHASGPGGADYEVNWRVDRIRESDIVLVREDATRHDLPSATRVIPLRTPEEEEQLLFLEE